MRYPANILDGTVTCYQKPSFDKPVPFIKMFDAKTRAALMQKINEIKDNAVHVTA